MAADIPSEILEALLRANLAAAVAVLLALALRRPVRAAFGATAAYALWAMAPVAAFASLLPAQRLFPSAQGLLPSEMLRFVVLPGDAPSSAVDLAPLALAAWLVGVVASVAVMAVRQVRLTRAAGRLSVEPGERSIARAERADIGPAVIGVLAPRIVLPTDFRTRYSPDEQAIIIAHETAHLKAGDTRINALIALSRCLAWFNPLVHVGAAYARLDQELARDAAVAARFPDARRAYAEAMLKAQLAAGAVALGCGWTPRTASLLKRRISMLAKPSPTRARRIAGAALAASASALVGLAAWAAQPGQDAPQPAPQPGAQLAQSGQQTPQPAPQPGQQHAQGDTPAPQGESNSLRPLVRVAPIYPPEALANNQIGACTITFDLTDEGATSDVTAECTNPVFTEAAQGAVEDWRYVRRADDVSGASRESVQVMLTFELAQEETPVTPEWGLR